MFFTATATLRASMGNIITAYERQPISRLPEPHHQQQPPCCCVPSRDVLELPIVRGADAHETTYWNWQQVMWNLLTLPLANRGVYLNVRYMYDKIYSNQPGGRSSPLTYRDPEALTASLLLLKISTRSNPRTRHQYNLYVTCNIKPGRTDHVQAKWRMPQPQQGPLLCVATPHRGNKHTNEQTVPRPCREHMPVGGHCSRLAPL